MSDIPKGRTNTTTGKFFTDNIDAEVQPWTVEFLGIVKNL